MFQLIRALVSRELFLLGVRDLRAHKLRSLLTALGIIFGVAAVICMLSIGEGQSAEQLDSIRRLGSQNIVLRSVEPPKSKSAGDSQDSIQRYGLTRLDVQRIRELPHVQDMVLMREVADTVTWGSRKFEGSVVGASGNLFDVVRVTIARGRSLTEEDSDLNLKVCVIGDLVAQSLFGYEEPLGKAISVISPASGSVPYTVVGVLGSVRTAGAPREGPGQRDLNKDILIPLKVADRRYGDMKVRWSRTNREMKEIQLSEAIVCVDEQDAVLAVSEMVERVLEHGRKTDSRDYEMTVPLQLLVQAEQVKRQRQLVLGSIAGISLLVGGIGIMNIMLASVTERTREIGIRRALGAKRFHITAQFLIETVLLSVSGGVIGIIIGISMAYAVTKFANWQTIISWWSVVISFLVSAAVGIGFGLYPARAAARLDPIEALSAKR